MTAGGEEYLAPQQAYVDPTQHRPGDCCEHCDSLDECPGYLGNRMTQRYRVEGWDADAWTMMSSASEEIADTQKRMRQLKKRFPQIPMRIVAETTTYMVVGTAPGNAPPTDGDQLT
ncbi:hypothetical protein [Streptomyces sp. NPDC048516]|uniref:hypothetical protein n=1 Tax=Streptomyces sp. NPDC048516 TaxID=3365565 RepID=UPI003722EC2F